MVLGLKTININVLMENFDLNIYLHNRPCVELDDPAFSLLLKRNHASVVDCNDEKREDVLSKLNGHNFFIIFTNLNHVPIGFSCADEHYAVKDMVRTILNTLNNE